MIQVAPTEPAQLKSLGEVTSAPENFGADVLILGDGYAVGVQRKKFPSDFLSSMQDGRLATSTSRLAANASESFLPLLLVEGRIEPRPDGTIKTRRKTRHTVDQIDGLLLSAMFVLGIGVHHTRSTLDTVRFLRYLESWAEKSRHDALWTRPSQRSILGVGKRITGYMEKSWILQGIRTVGPDTADKILSDNGGDLPLQWAPGFSNMSAIRGIGPKTVAALEEHIPTST